VRAAAAANADWQRFIATGRRWVQAQSSKIMLESKPIYAALGLPATAAFQGPTHGPRAPGEPPAAMYELRTYQLHPGYGSVPKLYEAFSKGRVVVVARASCRAPLPPGLRACAEARGPRPGPLPARGLSCASP
jgi:hypothetical protein